MNCIFCDKKLEDHLIKKYAHWNVYLSENQSYFCDCVVALNRHGVDRLYQLQEPERKEFFEVMEKLTLAIESHFIPDIFNAFILGNRDRNHLHLHLIPRYGREIEFEGEAFEDLDTTQPVQFPKPKRETPIEWKKKLIALLKKELDAQG